MITALTLDVAVTITTLVIGILGVTSTIGVSLVASFACLATGGSIASLYLIAIGVIRPLCNCYRSHADQEREQKEEEENRAGRAAYFRAKSLRQKAAARAKQEAAARAKRKKRRAAGNQIRFNTDANKTHAIPKEGKGRKYEHKKRMR